MPIDFSNVNITIQQFQQIASGKFNAGEVKLKSERSLDLTNDNPRITNVRLGQKIST